MVYIREAHPSDEWQVAVNEEQDVVFAQPTTFEQRAEVAQACSLGLDVSIPMVIDELTDDANRGYGAIPDRLFLVDEAGRVAFAGEPGPMGFRPDDLEAAITALLAGGSGRGMAARSAPPSTR